MYNAVQRLGSPWTSPSQLQRSLLFPFSCNCWHRWRGQSVRGGSWAFEGRALIVGRNWWPLMQQIRINLNFNMSYNKNNFYFFYLFSFFSFVSPQSNYVSFRRKIRGGIQLDVLLYLNSWGAAKYWDDDRYMNTYTDK